MAEATHIEERISSLSKVIKGFCAHIIFLEAQLVPSTSQEVRYYREVTTFITLRP